MSFYDLNVTKPIIKTNGTINLGQGGTPNLPKLTIGGILEKLHIITQATPVYTPGTGTIARDINGPYNFYSNVAVMPNQQVPIVNMSGYGAWMYAILKEALENKAAFPLDTQLVAPAGALDPTWVNSGSLITGASGAQNPLFTFPLPVYITQRMFNGIVGYWELGNPLAQLTVQLLTAYTGNGPYNIYSTAVGAQPYLVTGNATVTGANPTADIMRFLWDTPVNPADRPPVTFINTVFEDSFTQNVSSAQSLSYTFSPLSGYIARVMAYVVDSAVSKGVAPTNCEAANAFTFGIGDGTTLISENIWETALRQRLALAGFDLPQGMWFLDFLGPDLTWQSVFSTYDEANVNMHLNFASAVGASSYGKVIRQLLKPLQYTAQ